MNTNRPVLQVLAIILGTLLFALIGVTLLVGEVRQEFLQIVRNALAIPRQLPFSATAWRILFVLGLCVCGYLVLRKTVLAAVPSLHKAHECPHCGNRLQRIPRKPSERFLAVVLCCSILRYGCIGCEWSGLRRHRHQRHTS
ncbi:MAG: hypothetical protein ACOYYS_01780 [Chloroflexota bacterium]